MMGVLLNIRGRCSRITGELGAALVEFALVTVLFFTVVFAIIQGGIIFGSWIIVTNAAREGARYASVCITRAEMPPSLGNTYCEADATWTTYAGAISKITNYTRSRIAWPDPADPTFGMSFSGTNYDTAGTNRFVRVRIDYGVPLLAPLMGVVVPNPLPLSAESDMRIEL